MIWSLLNFYPQKDRGLESACKICKYESHRRQHARSTGRPYQCKSEYAAVRAVFPYEDAEIRRRIGIKVNPEVPLETKTSSPTPRRTYDRVRKPIPRPSTPCSAAEGPESLPSAL